MSDRVDSWQDWQYTGNFLKVSRSALYRDAGVGTGPNTYSAWSFEGSLLSMQRTETFADAEQPAGAKPGSTAAPKPSSTAPAASSTAPAAPQKSGGASSKLRTDEAAAYLQKHAVQSCIEEAINQVLAERPAEPLAAIAQALQRLQLQGGA